MNLQKKYYDDFMKSAKMHMTLLGVCLLVYLITLVINAVLPDSMDNQLTLLLLNGTLIVLLAINVFDVYYAFRRTGPILKECDDLRQNVYLDDLTGIPNRYSCDLVFQMYGRDQSIEHIGCALIVIGNLVTINESVSRDAGNQAIVDFSHILEDISEDFGFVGRNGGNEFLIVIEDCDQAKMDHFFEQLDIRLTRYNSLELNDAIDIYYKYVLNDELKAERFSEIITAVYQKLHTSARRKRIQ